MPNKEGRLWLKVWTRYLRVGAGQPRLAHFRNTTITKVAVDMPSSTDKAARSLRLFLLVCENYLEITYIEINEIQLTSFHGRVRKTTRVQLVCSGLLRG